MIFLPAIAVAMYAIFGTPVLPARKTETEDIIEDSDVINTELCTDKEQKQSRFSLNVFSRVPLLQFGKVKKMTSIDCQTDNDEDFPSTKKARSDKKQIQSQRSTNQTTNNGSPIRKGSQSSASSLRLANTRKTPVMKSRSLVQVGKTQTGKMSETPVRPKAASDAARVRPYLEAKSTASSSALERSRLAYEKKIRQLSGKCPAVSKQVQKFNAVCKKGFPTPPPSPMGSPRSKQKLSSDFRRTKEYDCCREVGSDIVQTEAKGLFRWKSLGRFLTRPFSASSTVDTDFASRTTPVSARPQRADVSPRTPTKKNAPSPWRPTGVVKSHSLGDTPATPVTPLRKGQVHPGTKLRRTKGSTKLSSAKSDGGNFDMDTQLYDSVHTSPLCHIGYYYFFSFVVFVCMQMYEAYFGGNMLQFLNRS